jgi:hypothetical protein
MQNANVTLAPTSLEFEALHLADSGQLCGFALRFNGSAEQGDIDSVTVPMTLDDAMELGAQLIAHADYLAGRPVRDWSKLTA